MQTVLGIGFIRDFKFLKLLTQTSSNAYFAETHGIRVVSKYSRSKAFDNNATTLNLASKKPESIEIRKTCIEVQKSFFSF